MQDTVFAILLALVGTPIAIYAILGIVTFIQARRGVPLLAPQPSQAAPSTPKPSVAPRAPEAPAPSPRCASCVHFDVEIGQKTIAKSGAFAQAAQHIPPWQMGADFDENGDPKVEPSREMLKLDWNDFGACMAPNDDAADRSRALVAKIDTCDKYEAIK